MNTRGCRLCAAPLDAAQELLNLGNMAYTGIFPNPGEFVPMGVLRVVRCPGCGLAQLDRRFDASELYGPTYGYRSGLSGAMVNHLTGIALDAAEYVKLKDGDAVLDIGCSDGTLLSAYKQDVIRVGFDPVVQYLDGVQQSAKILYHSDFFSARAYNNHTTPLRPAKIVTAIAMFYDLDDPVGFLQEINSVMMEDGLLVLELQFLPDCVEKTAFDIVCHEHFCYYEGSTLWHALRSAGFYVEDVSFNDINGGSIRIFASKKPSAKIDAINALFSRDWKSKTDAAWEALSSRIWRAKEQLTAYCKTNVVYGLGASTKGNVLLQHFGLTNSDIVAIGEINQTKFGKRTPGTNIDIVNEREIPSGNEITLMVLPWWLKDDIAARYRGRKLLFPLPVAAVVSPDGRTLELGKQIAGCSSPQILEA